MSDTPLHSITCQAGAEINKRRLVKFSAAATTDAICKAIQCAAATDWPIGVSYPGSAQSATGTIESLKNFTVHTPQAGAIHLEAGASVTADDDITSDSVGRGITGGAGDNICGKALTGASGAGKLFWFLPAASEITGIFIGDIGETGGTTTLLGGLRIGTGGTPDISLGDDDCYIEGTLEVDSEARFDGIVDMNSSMDISGAAVFNGAVTLGDAGADVITVTGTATFAETVTCTGAITVGTTLTVTGAATFNGAMTLGDAAGDTLTVTGTATFAETLTCSGALAVTGAANFDDAVTLGNASGDAITVTGTATFAETVTCTGAITVGTTLTVTGASTFNGAMTLGDAAGDTLTVTGTATFAETVTCTGAITVGTTLTVTGAATFNGAMTLGDAGADTITVIGTATFAEAIVASGGVTGDVTGSLTAGTLTAITGADASLLKTMDFKYVTIAEKGDVTFWEASLHPKAIITEVIAVLVEIPDGGATTMTIRLDDGTNNITDLLTFTQGTEIIGSTKKATIDSSWDNIAFAEKVDIAVGGSSAVLGEIVVYVRYTGEI